MNLSGLLLLSLWRENQFQDVQSVLTMLSVESTSHNEDVQLREQHKMLLHSPH